MQRGKAPVSEVKDEPSNDTATNVVSFEEERRRLADQLLADQNTVEGLIFDDDAKIAEMNKRHAFINSVGGKPMVLCYTYSAVVDRSIIEFRSPQSIIIQYSNQNVKQERGYIDLGTYWIRSAERREYDTVVFDPGLPREVKGCLNLYEGMSVVPAPGCWKRTLRHLYNVLCNKDPVKFKYTVRWFAWLVQNPGERAEVAVIFRGKEGAGKGFIFTQFLKIFAQHGVNISNREHLTGKFNGHLKQCVFLFADEAYYPGDKSVEGTLKQLITEEKIPVEDKYKTLGPSKNCLHIGMCTNQEWVIPAGEDSRRYFINEVDNSYAKNSRTDAERETYFSLLWGEMNEGGREAMIYDLLKMNLGTWHPRYNIPITEEMQRQRSLSVHKSIKYLQQFLEDGLFPGVRELDGSYSVTSDELFDYFVKLDPGSVKLSMKTKSIALKQIGVKKVLKNNKNIWEFGDLASIRAKWNEVHGAIDWEIDPDNPLSSEWRVTKQPY